MRRCSLSRSLCSASPPGRSPTRGWAEAMLESLLRIVALTRKELLAVLKDRRARNSLLLPPILQCLLFGYAATYDLNHVPYAVLDQDHGEASQALLAKLDGTGIFERAANLDRQSDVRSYIDDRRVLLVVQIPSDFSRRLQSGRGADIQVIADGRNSNTAGTALAYVQSAIEGFNAEWRADHGLASPPVTIED